MYEKITGKTHWYPYRIFEFISNVFGLLNIIIVYYILCKFIKPFSFILYISLGCGLFTIAVLRNSHHDSGSPFANDFHKKSCMIASIIMIVEFIVYTLFYFFC